MHQINTAMNYCISAEEKEQKFIAKVLASVKIFVLVFKHGNWKNDMRDGCAPIKESENRFGTTYSVVAS